ncbi:MAG TPA: GAF domain-containing protein [Candidatus Caenarcaniphilales bacterium]|nr:GAF domain-containing protein [Candidatus Caenarcaniphilales bacterium]
MAEPVISPEPTSLIARLARAPNDDVALLLRAGELLGSSLDFETTLAQIAQLIVPGMADWAAVDVLDESGAFRRVGVAHIDAGREELLRELDRLYPIRANEGRLRGRVVATRRPVALYDITDDELASLARDPAHREMLRRLGVRSALWVPLIARDRVLGVISTGYGAESGRYGPDDLQLLGDLARRAALAVDNALLYQAVGRAERRQAAIATLGRRALAGDSLPDLLNYSVRSLADMLEVPFAEFLEVARDEEVLRLVAGVGWPEGMVGGATIDAAAGSQGGYALARVGPILVRDLAAETRFRPPPLFVEQGIVSGVTVVIGGPARPYGILGAHSDTPREFEDDDVNFVQAVANVLAAAIERQRTEDRLSFLAASERARAAELKAVIESIGDAVVVCDAAGAVVLANPAAEELLGEMLGGGISGILASFSWPTGMTAPKEARRLEGLELALRRRGRETEDERWIELTTYPVVVGEEGASADGGTILVLRDVTLARNARAVREAFLGILSHELRTPVTTIYGGSEMLARAGADVADEVRREVYEDIRAEADRLYRLVENLLVLSRVERQGLQLESEPVLLQRLVPRVVHGEAGRWPSVHFNLELGPALPPVAAEETYLEQVLRNVIVNAAKYGGEEVEVRAEAAGDVVRLTVADRGPGFDPADSRRLFDIFYRSPEAARRASGAGIGLFVSQQLISAMHGRMWASNRPGGGAEFGLEVPTFGPTGD